MNGWELFIRMFWPQIVAETIETVAEVAAKKANPRWYGRMTSPAGIRFVFKRTAVVVDCTCGHTFVVKYPLGHRVSCYKCKSWSYQVDFNEDGKPQFN